jgi:hypothetical protein
LPPVSIAEQFETARFASAHGDGVSPQRASA